MPALAALLANRLPINTNAAVTPFIRFILDPS
jgi:hypothetical protein